MLFWLCTLFATGLLVAGQTSPSASLADKLAATADDAARTALLNADPAAVSKELWNECKKRADNPNQSADKARTWALVSLDIATRLGDPALQSSSLISLSITSRRLGRDAEAVEASEKAVGIVERMGDRSRMANALAQLALTQADAGDLTRALATGERAFSLMKDLGDEEGVARVLTNVGSVYRVQGDLRRALECYVQVREICERRGIIRGLAYAENNIGTVYFAQDNFELALEHQQRSLLLKEKFASKGDLARSLANIGYIESLLGRRPQALAHLRRAKDLAETIKEPVLLAPVLINLGEVEKVSNHTDAALEWYRQALAVCDKIQRPELRKQALVNIAEVTLAQGHAEEAVAAAREAAAITEARETKSWRAPEMLGLCLLGAGRKEEAKAAFSQAIDAIEEARIHVVGGEQQQELFFERRADPYQRMARLLLEEGQTAEALRYAERVKARVLLDVLHDPRADVHKAMSADERATEKRLLSELSALSARPGPESRLAATRREFEMFRANLYVKHPDLKVWRGEGGLLDPTQLQSTVDDGNTAALEYMTGEDQALLFVVTAPGHKLKIDTYVIAASRQDLQTRAEQLRASFANRDMAFRPAARALYQMLIAPAEAQLRNVRHLIIVPDGPLWILPFQALQPDSSHYLLERHALSYAPSLAALAEIRRMHPRSPKGMVNVLAFANPTPAAGTVAGSDLRDLPRSLPETEEDVRTLTSLYGASRVTRFTGNNALEARFKAEAGRYRVIHLATHGVLDNRNPLYSHLLLSPDSSQGSEDGRLEAWELMELRLRADVVVLSACETARGRVGAGEGMIGMSWALFIAGSPSTVASQWKVDSASTTRLMSAFHRELKPVLERGASVGTGKDAALQTAAISLLRDPRTSHPFYWAGFVLMGDAR